MFTPSRLCCGLCLFTGIWFSSATLSAQSLPPAGEDPRRPAGLTLRHGTTNSWMDAQGNPYTRAATGRWSNYDENKVGQYTLPDPLTLNNGQPVRDSATWFQQRRPEILAAYYNQLFGRIPSNAPSARFELLKEPQAAFHGTAVLQEYMGKINGATNPGIPLRIYLPSGATRPVPLIITVGPGLSAANPAGKPATLYGGAPLAEILARGWAFAEVGVYSIQADRNSFTNGVIGLTLPPGTDHPAPDQWGVIAAWSWGLSQVMDYLETNPDIDCRHVALEGHSRWGKTVLWTAARDSRFALVYASCSGEMGAALSRRDWGETIDNMAGNLRYQFAGNFVQYAGHWNDLPVDAHELIALVAPRPVFITGGSQDQWADPHGEFLAEVAAGPVYRLLGHPDLGTTNLPPLDTVLASGDLAFKEHQGGHAATTEDWRDFLKFAAKYFPRPHPAAPAQ